MVDCWIGAGSRPVITTWVEFSTYCLGLLICTAFRDHPRLVMHVAVVAVPSRLTWGSGG